MTRTSFLGCVVVRTAWALLSPVRVDFIPDSPGILNYSPTAAPGDAVVAQRLPDPLRKIKATPQWLRPREQLYMLVVR